MDSLHRVGGVLGDLDASAGRAGEAHHVDIGVNRERDADTGAIALHEIENTRWAHLRHASPQP